MLPPLPRSPARSPARSWQSAPVDEERVAALAAAIGVRPLTAAILLGRGFGDSARAARFLAPRLADLRRPDGMADLDRTLDRLTQALAARERIAVFGDYDVDGVTTAAILATTLRALGGDVIAARRQPPRRLRRRPRRRRALRRRGLSRAGHRRLRHQRPRSARARPRARYRRDRDRSPPGAVGREPGLRAHQPAPPDDRFPFKGLASCGVAFYLAAALRSRLARRSDAASIRATLLDLVALGTIADLVPLVDENRILVAAGLRVATARKRPGLRALTKLAAHHRREPDQRRGRQLPPGAAPERRRPPGRGAAGAGSAAGARRRNRRSAGRGAGRSQPAAPADPGTGVDRGADAPRAATRPTPRWWSAPKAGTPAWSGSSPPSWSTGSPAPRW